MYRRSISTICVHLHEVESSDVFHCKSAFERLTGYESLTAQQFRKEVGELGSQMLGVHGALTQYPPFFCTNIGIQGRMLSGDLPRYAVPLCFYGHVRPAFGAFWANEQHCQSRVFAVDNVRETPAAEGGVSRTGHSKDLSTCQERSEIPILSTSFPG